MSDLALMEWFFRLWIVILNFNHGRQVLKNYLRYTYICTQLCHVTKSVRFSIVASGNVAAAGETFCEFFHHCSLQRWAALQIFADWQIGRGGSLITFQNPSVKWLSRVFFLKYVVGIDGIISLIVFVLEISLFTFHCCICFMYVCVVSLANVFRELKHVFHS